MNQTIATSGFRALILIPIILITLCLKAHSKDKDRLVTFPEGSPVNKSLEYTVQLSLPGQNMPAKVDQFNWRFAAYHHKIILVNFEVNYELIQSTADLENAYHRVMSAVDDLRSQGYNIPPEKIILTGTSRGGALAISFALHHPETFKRVGIVSGAFPWFWVYDIADRAKGIHFFIIHGREDAVIPLERAQKTIDHLIKNGATVKYEILDHAGHNLNSAAYAKTLDWIADDIQKDGMPPK